MLAFPFTAIISTLAVIFSAESGIVPPNYRNSAGITLVGKIQKEIQKHISTTSSSSFLYNLLAPLQSENCQVVLRDYTYFDFFVSREVPIVLQLLVLNKFAYQPSPYNSAAWSVARHPIHKLGNIHVNKSIHWNCSSQYMIKEGAPGLDFKMGGGCISINETRWSLAIRPWRCLINIDHYFPISAISVISLQCKTIPFIYASIR